MNAKTTCVNEFAAAVTARPTPSQQRQLGQQLATFKLLPISLGSRARSGKSQVQRRQRRKEVRRTLLKRERMFGRTKKTGVEILGRGKIWVAGVLGRDGLVAMMVWCDHGG